MLPPETAKLLWDMHNAAARIQRFTVGKTYDDYRADELLRSAVERQFEIIGEAMTRLVKGVPDIAAQVTDHRKICGFRNVLIHGYDSIDDETSWGIVEQKLPVLRRELGELLQAAGMPPNATGPGPTP